MRKEMMEISIYMAKLYKIAEPEKAKKIIECAEKESKTIGLSYKEILEDEFIKLLGGDE